MLPEEGGNAHARYARRVQVRRVGHGVQSDHMERLVDGARPKRALKSFGLLVRGASRRAIVKLLERPHAPWPVAAGPRRWRRAAHVV